MDNQIIIGPASIPQEQALNSTSDITLYGGAAGSGKALRHGEKVLTPSGFVNIEDVAVGDLIITPKNTTEVITGVYPQGLVDIYRVTFQDGSFVDTCGEHLWQYHEARGRGSIKVDSTLYLKERLSKGFRPIVPLCEPVEFGNSILPIKPYTLGVLLGDGSISTRSVSFSSVDPEIVEYVKAEGYTVTHWTPNDTRNAKVYGIANIQQALRGLDLLGTRSNDKFIPEEYFFGSVEDKFSLVQGLMDTDGYVDKLGNTSFCTVSKQLAKDMKSILHSLGFTVTISEKAKTYTYKGEKLQGQLAYELYIRGRYQSKLFKLSRKKDKTKEKVVGNRVVSVEKVGEDLATCISISGNDKLFITTNFIVTHNTYTLLITALRFMMVPRSTGVIFRRTSKMLDAPGSIWQEAVTMYTTIFPKIKIRDREHEVIFENGSVLKFSHMQHEKNAFDHKGGQYSFVAFDEATDFTEMQVTFLLSRMRNANVNYTPQMYLCTNPNYHSFLRKWIQDFYLDPVDGTPINEKSNIERYFVRRGNEMIWYDDRSEAEAIYGKGPTSGIRSFRFCSAKIWDNPFLRDSDYLSNLMSLNRVEKLIMLEGSWTARAETSGYWHRNNVEIVDFAPIKVKKRVMSADFAFTVPSETMPDPDSTAFVLMSKDEHNVYTIEHVHTMQERSHTVEAKLFQLAETFGREVIYTIPCDPNAAAAQYARNLQRQMAEKGFNCKLVKPVKSKLVRFQPFASVTEAKFVRVVRGDWNDAYFDQLEIFDGLGKFHDDMVDATSDAFLTLNTGVELPTMSIPNIAVAPSHQSFHQSYQQNPVPFTLPTFKL